MSVKIQRAVRAAAAVALFVAVTARAHDTWLLAQRTDAAAPPRHAMALTSGMDFPQPDYAIAPTRIAASGCRSAAGRCVVRIGKRGADALAFAVAPADVTAALVWVDLAAKTLSLDDEKVAEYLDEIDAGAEIRAAWETMDAPRHWRERYVKHAKALLGSDEAAVAAGSHSLGGALEIVVARGSSLQRDADATFRLLADGKPLADFPVGAVTAKRAQSLRSDANGDVRVRLDRAGPWMLRATRLTPASGAQLDWTSDFATLTFEVE